MGNQQSFAEIEKKYGPKGVDYVASKYHERKIYERINDQILRLNEHARLQEQEDIEFLSQQKRKLEKSLNDAKVEAETKKKGSIAQAEAKSKNKVEALSGYNNEVAKLEKLEKQVKEKYASQKVRMEEKVREEVKKHQSSSALNKIPEYDNHPDNYRRSIQNECIKSHPNKAKQVDSTELERKLTWENYKQNFVTILNRDQIRKETDQACEHIRKSVVPGGAPICC